MPEASAVNTAENRPIPSTQEEWEAASARLKESQEAFDRSAQALDKHLTGKSETDPNKKLSETDIQEGVSRADEMISEVQAAINYLSGLRNFSGEPLADITDAIGQLEAQKSNIQALRMQLENARISPAEARALLMGMQAAVGAAVDRASESAHTAASEFKSEIYGGYSQYEIDRQKARYRELLADRYPPEYVNAAIDSIYVGGAADYFNGLRYEEDKAHFVGINAEILQRNPEAKRAQEIITGNPEKTIEARKKFQDLWEQIERVSPELARKFRPEYARFFNGDAVPAEIVAGLQSALEKGDTASIGTILQGGVAAAEKGHGALLQDGLAGMPEARRKAAEEALARLKSGELTQEEYKRLYTAAERKPLRERTAEDWAYIDLKMADEAAKLQNTNIAIAGVIQQIEAGKYVSREEGFEYTKAYDTILSETSSPQQKMEALDSLIVRSGGTSLSSYKNAAPGTAEALYYSNLQRRIKDVKSEEDLRALFSEKIDLESYREMRKTESRHLSAQALGLTTQEYEALSREERTELFEKKANELKLKTDGRSARDAVLEHQFFTSHAEETKSIRNELAALANSDDPQVSKAVRDLLVANGGIVTDELVQAVNDYTNNHSSPKVFVRQLTELKDAQTEVGTAVKATSIAAYMEKYPDHKETVLSILAEKGVDVTKPETLSTLDITELSLDASGGQQIWVINHKMNQPRGGGGFNLLTPEEQKIIVSHQLGEYSQGAAGIASAVNKLAKSEVGTSAIDRLFEGEMSAYERALRMEHMGMISGQVQTELMTTIIDTLGPQKAKDAFRGLADEKTREAATAELMGALSGKSHAELVGDDVAKGLWSASETAKREASDALARATSDGREIPAFMQDEIYASAYNSAYAKEVNKLAEAEEKARSAKSDATEAGTADAATSTLRSENRYVQRSGLDPRYLQSQILSAEETAIRDAYSEASPELLRGMMRADIGGGMGGADEFILDPVAQERDRINFNAELKLNESLYEMYTTDPGRFASARPPSNEGLVREGAKKHMTQEEYTRLRKENPNLTYDQAMGQATAFAAAKLEEDAKLEPVGVVPEQPMDLVAELSASKAKRKIPEVLAAVTSPLLAKTGEVGGPVLPSIMGQGSAKTPVLGPVVGSVAVETPAADTTAEPPKPTAAQLELQALKERELAGYKAAAEQYAQDPARYDNAAPGSPEEKIKKDAFEHYVEEEMARLSGGVIDGSAMYFDQAEAYAKAKLEEIAAKAKEAVPMVSADPSAHAEEAEYQRLIALGESPEKARALAKGIVAAGQTAVAAGVTTDSPAKKEEVAAKTTEEAAKEAAKPATEAGATGGEEKTADAPAKENAALVAQAQTTPDGRVAGPV